MSPALPCRLCGVRPAGSREHLPGVAAAVAAANAGPVRVRHFVGEAGVRGGADYETRVNRDGLVVRTTFDRGNHRICSNNGGAYKSFVGRFSGCGVLDDSARRC
jgi:hypothetical protein